MSARLLASALALFVVAPLVLSPLPASSQEAAAKSLSKAELDQILAPIALYPDDLLSNVLVAATYPVEVVQAARWVEEPANAKLKGAALTKALDAKDWDPSVKALTQFPDVLAMMSKRLEWTQKLGDAFLASEAGVMDRIQFLRDKAEAAGNLKSNEHQTVTTRHSGGSDYIYIEPAQRDVVYVPVYEPAVYGDWWYPDYPPYYWPADGPYVDDYYWGSGVSVFLPLWGWSRPRWHDHYIHVNVNRYNRINRHRHKISSDRWRHDAHHRRGGKVHASKSRRRHIQERLREHRAHDDHKRRGRSAKSGAHKPHASGGKGHHHASSRPGSRSSAHKHSRGRSSAHRHSRGRSHARAHHRGGHKAHRGGHRGRAHRSHGGRHRGHAHRSHGGGRRAHGGGHHRGGGHHGHGRRH